MAATMNNSTEAASSLEFFKVFLPDTGSLHMSIPPAFVKHLHVITFPNKATIKDYMGKSWHVTLEKLDDLVYFKNGWQAFVDYHFLRYGDFLIFQYDGHYTFDVKIFGKNGCKKAVVAEAGNSVPILEAVVAEPGNSVPIMEIKQEPVDDREDVKPLHSRKRKCLQVGSEKVHKSRRTSARNLREPPSPPSNSTEIVPSKGPCFERIMKRWSLGTLYISRGVVEEHNISLKPNIVLRDEEGKLWPVTAGTTSQNRMNISSGWPKFYRGHNLRINDKCEFEFVLGRGNVCRQVNVKITRSKKMKSTK
ncbi:putative B3 domain-containing protein At5g66980 [Momordica charantia]|uniref:B3 domain-containing protein At5g66980 n=1 Tax=Momordica charantia TaxID=3673 RepID=A0A6J1BT36_MOMCH|nr:putative B3 domain-containing protein At5g66980 [Momordica charantia]